MPVHTDTPPSPLTSCVALFMASAACTAASAFVRSMAASVVRWLLGYCTSPRRDNSKDPHAMIWTGGSHQEKGHTYSRKLKFYHTIYPYNPLMN